MKRTALTATTGICLALAACSSSGAAASTGGPASPVDQNGECSMQSIAISPTGEFAEGQQGTGSITLMLSSSSDATCTLSGFPAVQLLDAAGAPVGAVEPDPYAQPASVDVPAGGSAYFSIISRAESSGACAAPRPVATQVALVLSDGSATGAADVPVCASVVTPFRSTAAA